MRAELRAVVPSDESELTALGMPAVGGHVEGGDELPLIGQHLAAGSINRRIRLLPLVGQSAVRLIGLARPEIEVATLAKLPNREGACRDGLRFQCLDSPVGRHLGRHHALQIVLHWQNVEREDASRALRNDLQQAGIAALLGTRAKIASHDLHDVRPDARGAGRANGEWVANHDGCAARAVGSQGKDLGLT